MSYKKLTALHSKIIDIRTALSEIKDKAEETFDNRSEKWQESDAGITYGERINYMENALSNLESVLENLEDATVND